MWFTGFCLLAKPATPSLSPSSNLVKASFFAFSPVSHRRTPAFESWQNCSQQFFTVQQKIRLRGLIWWTVQDSVTHNFLLKICATPSQSPSLLPTFESCTCNPQRCFIQIASRYFHESWWTVQDSNLPPPHCKCGALPDELTAQ